MTHVAGRRETESHAQLSDTTAPGQVVPFSDTLALVVLQGDPLSGESPSALM